MGAWQMARSREARRRGRMGKQEMAASGKNRIRIFGPKTDGTYIVEVPCISVLGRSPAVRAPVAASDATSRRCGGTCRTKAAAPASPSTEETMSQQIGARGRVRKGTH